MSLFTELWTAQGHTRVPLTVGGVCVNAECEIITEEEEQRALK